MARDLNSVANPPVGPSDFIIAAPQSVTFTAINLSQVQQIQVTSGATGGKVSELDNCSKNGTKVVAIGTPTQVGGALTYSITPLHSGNCKVTFTNAKNATTYVTISVTK